MKKTEAIYLEKANLLMNKTIREYNQQSGVPAKALYHHDEVVEKSFATLERLGLDLQGVAKNGSNMTAWEQWGNIAAFAGQVLYDAGLTFADCAQYYGLNPSVKRWNILYAAMAALQFYSNDTDHSK